MVKMHGRVLFVEGLTSSGATRLELFADLLDPPLHIAVLPTAWFCCSGSTSQPPKGMTLEG